MAIIGKYSVGTVLRRRPGCRWNDSLESHKSSGGYIRSAVVQHEWWVGRNSTVSKSLVESSARTVIALSFWLPGPVLLLS